MLGILGHDGCFAEYVTVPVRNLLEVPAEVEDERAVLTEPLAAAFEILEQVESSGQRVAVLGDGQARAPYGARDPRHGCGGAADRQACREDADCRGAGRHTPCRRGRHRCGGDAAGSGLGRTGFDPRDLHPRFADVAKTHSDVAFEAAFDEATEPRRCR